jgi:Flp pilus assembly pilin Flp
MENQAQEEGAWTMKQIKKFFNNESGVTMGEYCKLVVLIVAVIWGSINSIAIFINR